MWVPLSMEIDLMDVIQSLEYVSTLKLNKCYARQNFVPWVFSVIGLLADFMSSPSSVRYVAVLDDSAPTSVLSNKAEYLSIDLEVLPSTFSFGDLSAKLKSP